MLDHVFRMYLTDNVFFIFFLNRRQRIFEIAVKRGVRERALDCEIARQLIFDLELCV